MRLIFDGLAIFAIAFIGINFVGAWAGYWTPLLLSESITLIFGLVVGGYFGARVHRWWFYSIIKLDPTNQVNSDAFWRGKWRAT